MAEYQVKLVSVRIVATDRHCSNDCPSMSIDAQNCAIFNSSLEWDKRKKTHGNKRLPACKKAERGHPL